MERDQMDSLPEEKSPQENQKFEENQIPNSGAASAFSSVPNRPPTQ